MITPESADMAIGRRWPVPVILSSHRPVSEIVSLRIGDTCYAAQIRRLRNSGSETVVPGRLIADRCQFNPEWVQNPHVLGMTAGASAPDALTDGMIDACDRLGPVEVCSLSGDREASPVVFGDGSFPAVAAFYNYRGANS